MQNAIPEICPRNGEDIHKDSWVFNRVTIPFPNSHFAISSSAGIVNYSMSSHEKKFAQTFTLIFPPQQANVGFRFQNVFPQGLQRQVPHKVLRQKLIFCRILEIWREEFFSSTFFFVSWRRLIIFLGEELFFKVCRGKSLIKMKSSEFT